MVYRLIRWILIRFSVLYITFTCKEVILFTIWLPSNWMWNKYQSDFIMKFKNMLFQSQAPVRSCQQPLSSCSRPGQSETCIRSVGKPWSCLLNYIDDEKWKQSRLSFPTFLRVFFLVWNVRLLSYTLSKFTNSYCIQNECSVRTVTDYNGSLSVFFNFFLIFIFTACYPTP